VKLPEGDIAKLEALRPGVATPEWAFRFLQGIDAVTMTLSGMSNMEQLQENIATYADSKPLNEQESQVLMEIADDMIARNAVPCTGCQYCVDHCPMNIPIPEVIKLYNALAEGGTEKPGIPGPADCVACNSCMNHCPQSIDVAKVMADFASKL
jgi:predicted aldo/keto reductase-like oxidoreductase